MTLEQLTKINEDDEGYPLACYNIVNEVIELGKYYDDSFLENYKQPVFDRPEVQADYEQDHDFYIIGSEGVKAIIEDYRKKIIKNLKGVLNAKEFDTLVTGIETPRKYVEEKILDWENPVDIYPYNLNLLSEDIISSWKYEYGIFEIVRVYKSINWKTQTATITAW